MELASAFLFIALDTTGVVRVTADAGAFTFLEATAGQVAEGRRASQGEVPSRSHAFGNTLHIEGEDCCTFCGSSETSTLSHIRVHGRAFDIVPSILILLVRAVSYNSRDVRRGSIGDDFVGRTKRQDGY